MLFMDIITWDPKDNVEVGTRFSKWEYPEGIKVISEWQDLSSCRSIIVYDAENSEAYAYATIPWMDICRFDSFPVMDPSQSIEIMTKCMK